MKNFRFAPNGNLPTIFESEKGSSLPLHSSRDEFEKSDQNNLRATLQFGEEKNRGVNASSPLWSGSMDGWNLSWPIWHMLPRHERKNIAQQHGYKSIGEFEEYMSLQQAVENSEGKESSTTSLIQEPYLNESIYGSWSNTTKGEEKENPVHDKPSNEDTDEDEKDEENGKDSSPEDEMMLYGRQGSSIRPKSDEPIVPELIPVGGKLLMIHDELFHKIFAFLPVDAYGTLALVSPHWKHVTRTESVYRRLCERLYLNQSKGKHMRVSRFGGSYRKMLEVRPRVRASGGCYVLKYTQVKHIQRDMWTEVPVGAILENIYYR
jgi:F-box protein 9